MHKIFKYYVLKTDYFELEMPRETNILTFQIQRGRMQIWAIVDPEAPLERRGFRLSGTGHPIAEPLDDLRYIGSVQMNDETLIFHLFEVRLRQFEIAHEPEDEEKKDFV